MAKKNVYSKHGYLHFLDKIISRHQVLKQREAKIFNDYSKIRAERMFLEQKLNKENETFGSLISEYLNE